MNGYRKLRAPGGKSEKRFEPESIMRRFSFYSVEEEGAVLRSPYSAPTPHRYHVRRVPSKLRTHRVIVCRVAYHASSQPDVNVPEVKTRSETWGLHIRKESVEDVGKPPAENAALQRNA
jgi:hypothetical protein